MPNQEKDKPAATVTATEAVAPPPPSQPRLQQWALRHGPAASSYCLAERRPVDRLSPRIQQAAGHQLLRSRARYVTFARSLLVLHPPSDYDSARIRGACQKAQLPGGRP